MLFEAEDICFRYNDKSRWILNNVSLSVKSGERVGITAPSGYGKSTLGKIITGYLKPISGNIKINGSEIPKKGYCPVQMLFQHPELAVNPRWKMKKVLNEACIPEERILTKLGIEKDWLTRWSSELSGGELQRFCIARILNDMTKFIVCDEITTMLDVITQAQIWKFLIEISNEKNYGMIIITHNMALAKKVCTRIIKLDEINSVVKHF